MRGNLYIKYLAILFLSLIAILAACGSDDGRHVRDINGSPRVSNIVTI